MSLLTLSPQEKDKFKIVAVLRQLVQTTEKLTGFVFTPQQSGSPGPGLGIDNYSYIVAAIAAAHAQGGGTIFLSHGDWYHGTPLVISYDDIFIVGQSRQSTRLIYSGAITSDPAVRFGNGTALVTSGGIENLTIYGGQATSSAVLNVDTVQQAAFENIDITGVQPGSGGYGLYLNSADIAAPNNVGINYFRNVQVISQEAGATACGIVVDDSGVHERAASRNTFINCGFFAASDTATSYCINLGHCDSNLFVECDFGPSGAIGNTVFFTQSVSRPGFPSGNMFVHCFPENASSANVFGGTPGDGPSLWFGWDDQVTVPSFPYQNIFTFNGLNYRGGVTGSADGKVAPPTMPSYAKASLPSAALTSLNPYEPRGYRLIIVTDETGGLVPAFNDGTNWRRVTDRAVVS